MPVLPCLSCKRYVKASILSSFRVNLPLAALVFSTNSVCPATIMAEMQRSIKRPNLRVRIAVECTNSSHRCGIIRSGSVVRSRNSNVRTACIVPSKKCTLVDTWNACTRNVSSKWKVTKLLPSIWVAMLWKVT